MLARTSLEPRRLQFRIIRISLPRIDALPTSLRLAFLTDFHIGGPGPSTALTHAAFEQLRAWKPDIVLLGGDYFDQGRIIPTTAFDTLTLFPRVYAVLGNHDHRRGPENASAIARFLASRGAVVLQNERLHVTVERDHRVMTVELVGLDDPYTGLDDPSLLANPPGAVPRILLAHAPLLLDRIPLGCADLALFGHTHWGQIRLTPSGQIGPLDAAWYLDRMRRKPHSRLQRGWFWERGMLAYVSAGIGLTQLPFRLFAPPEVLLLEFDAEATDPCWPCDDPRRFVRVANS
nr:metallophosphoesterase [Thermomicrobium sp. CFH 73360]